jgi:cyclophilin family peptidyl-prolyl cis-trans isomerase
LDLINLLNRNDAGISYTVALAFQDTAIQETVRKKYLPQLRAAYSEMKGNNDIEPMIEMIKVFSQLNDSASIPLLIKSLSDNEKIIRAEAKKALKDITSKEYGEQLIGETTQQQQTNLDEIYNYSGARIETSKGNIRLRFLKNAAPFTIQSFISLVKKSFYNNLTFHRVVSNFVIQGGDPLGNGSGGPGYSIRTEVHPDVRYDKAGMVGIASAGKDTEGSQFFITHCATPHLDGRYTIFAETNDIDVVNKIMVGDSIKQIILLSHSNFF